MNRLLARLKVRRGAGLVLLEDFIGELQERALIGAQGIRSDIFQILLDLATDFGEDGNLLGMRQRLFLKLGLELRISGFKFGCIIAERAYTGF